MSQFTYDDVSPPVTLTPLNFFLSPHWLLMDPHKLRIGSQAAANNVDRSQNTPIKRIFT